MLVTLLVITVGLTFYAVFASPESKNAAVSLNLIWGYALLASAVIAALACATWGLLKSPAGLKGALLSALP